MNSLLFLTNELQAHQLQEKYRVKLTYISTGILFGKMYRNGKSVFNDLNTTRATRNKVIYGTLFHVNYFSEHIKAIDAYHNCSKALIHRNHLFDEQHRVLAPITLINFKSTDDLKMLRYDEGNTLTAHIYIGNTAHQRIKNKIYDPPKRYRIQSALHSATLTAWEENNES